MCYNIRYIDRNNRGDPVVPWSERQVAVYHRYNSARGQPIWIIVQAPQSIKSVLKQLNSHRADKPPSLSDHLGFHTIIFVGLARSWRDYLNFLESRLSEKVSHFSSLFKISVLDDGHPGRQGTLLQGWIHSKLRLFRNIP